MYRNKNVLSCYFGVHKMFIVETYYNKILALNVLKITIEKKKKHILDL